ncbi:MAG: hypothetical protein RL026_1830, partial [Pseudomonadota bacterium]
MAGRTRTLPALSSLLLAFVAAAAPAAEITAGAGRYYDEPRSALHARPRSATYVTDEVKDQAVPTNQWYSSVVFLRWSMPLYAHPVSYQATPAGMEVGLPPRQVGTYDGSREVRY